MKTYKGPYTIYYTMHYKNVKQCNMEEQALALVGKSTNPTICINLLHT